MHSSDQCKVCCPLTSLHVRRSPKPFLAILEYCKKSKSEAGGLGTRLCILLASYPACCQDYAICHRFSDSYSRSNSWLPPLAHGVHGHCITLDSQPDQDLDQQRQSAGSSVKICASWLAFSKVKGSSAAELEEARVVCAGCLCTLGCKSCCSTTRKRARTTRDTCTIRHCKYEKLGKKLCVVGEPGCRPGAKVRTYTKCRSSRPP